jgi:hypothetical protein
MTEASAAVAAAPVAAPSPEASQAPADNASDNVVKEESQAPISTQPKPAEPAKPEKPKTAADSVKAARERVEKNEAQRERRADKKEGETEAKAADKPAQATTEPVKAAEPAKTSEATTEKPAQTERPAWAEAPKRFNDVEKAEWDKAPESAKQGIHRAITELEKGIETHKAASAEMTELREFKDLAQKHGVTLKQAMSNYVGLEMDLKAQDPQKKAAAIEEVLRVAGITPQQYAAYITGKPQERQAADADRTTHELRNGLQQISQQVKTLAERQAEADEAAATQELNAWAQDKPHAVRLAKEIATHYREGLSLDEAYAKAVSDAQDMAQALGFIPQAPAPSNGALPAAHTPKVDKAIAGAPGAGSYPATKQPSKSVADAVRRAQASLN